MASDDPRIYFTDFFGVSPEQLEAHGAFDVSLINDLPLFIDPFLLFDSENPQYQRLHEDIIRYVCFLRDRSVESANLPAMVQEWFHFPEVKQNWLGFSKTGNGGSGLGREFAAALYSNLRSAFRGFGGESISQGSHLEKLCLLEGGIGRDHLSDFTANLIKGFLLEYTQDFARRYLLSSQRRPVPVQKVVFSYDHWRWSGRTYELPWCNSDFVLLTPKDILTKDQSWINRADLLDRVSAIYPSLPDEQLRARVNDYFCQRLSGCLTTQEVSAVRADAVKEFPELLDYYILEKERSGDRAHQESALKVRSTEDQFGSQVRTLVLRLHADSDFYRERDSFEAALRRVQFLKDVIENKDGYRVFYIDGKPVKREADVQVMFRLVWYGSPYEVDREVNNGRGPVDFKISHGSADKALVEFKLASNSQLKRNLRNQVAIYEAASGASRSIKVVLCFSASEVQKVMVTLGELGLAGRQDVVVIDADATNKPSASKA